MTLKRIEEGKSFEEIVHESLGASPIDIKRSLKRLMEQDSITATKYDNLLKKSEWCLPKIEKEVYITHMLDGDWKFNYNGIRNIIDAINTDFHSLREKKIAFLGTPTLFRESIILNIGVKRTLIDKNAQQYERFSLSQNDTIINIDIMSSNISDIITNDYDIVIMDPPWYFDMFFRFILEAKKILKSNGLIYCVYPQEYTRPTIQEEYNELISRLQDYDITLKTGHKGIVSYTTPIFEECVLYHEGIALKNRDWRRADLLCFECCGINSKSEDFLPIGFSVDGWEEVRVYDVCFKYRRSAIGKNSRNIIESPFYDAVLPTFSARDFKTELKNVNLWSSSNHVYTCGNLSLFIEILHFVSAGANYVDKSLILEYLKANTPYDVCELTDFVDQALEIITSEIDIVQRWIASYNQNKSFFISDYDGTIKCGDYTDRNLEKLREIAKMQHTGIIICSGRKYDYLKKVMGDADVPVDYFVCSNGAEIYDKKGFCIDVNPLTAADINLLDFLLEGESKISKVVKPMFDLKNLDLLWLVFPKNMGERTYNEIKKRLNCFKDGDKILISSKDASKDHALACLKKYGVESCKYIGDGESDVLSVNEYNGRLLKNASSMRRAEVFRTFGDRFILERQLLDLLLSGGYVAEYREMLQKRNYHLAVFIEPYLSYIKSGKKTLESRFSKNRIAPYGNVKRGDYIFAKRSSGKVEGFFKVDEVWEYDLDGTTLSHIKEQYEELLCVDDEFWDNKKSARFATIIKILDYRPLTPSDVSKKGMSGWVSL